MKIKINHEMNKNFSIYLIQNKIEMPEKIKIKSKLNALLYQNKVKIKFKLKSFQNQK